MSIDFGFPENIADFTELTICTATCHLPLATNNGSRRQDELLCDRQRKSVFNNQKSVFNDHNSVFSEAFVRYEKLAVLAKNQDFVYTTTHKRCSNTPTVAADRHERHSSAWTWKTCKKKRQRAGLMCYRTEKAG